MIAMKIQAYSYSMTGISRKREKLIKNVLNLGLNRKNSSNDTSCGIIEGKKRTQGTINEDGKTFFSFARACRP